MYVTHVRIHRAKGIDPCSLFYYAPPPVVEEEKNIQGKPFQRLAWGVAVFAIIPTTLHRVATP